MDAIMRSLGRKFRFGYYTPEELTQEAYILAWECVPRWDGERPLAAFIYTHLHNQLYNVKRKKYERIEPPCTNCPLNAYINKQCTAYQSLEDCKYYSQWLSRNTTKRNLMNLGSLQDGTEYIECTHEDVVDTRDLYEYTLSFLEPDERMQVEEDQSLSLDQINKIRTRMGLAPLDG